MTQLSWVAVTVAQVALAQGALDVRLEAADRASLERSIEAARRSHPEAFRKLAAVRAALPRLDRQKRGPYAPLTSWLNAIPDATWALADAIAFSGALDPATPRSALIAWQAGLLESLGARRDSRTEPLLRAALAIENLPLPVRRSAADALGRLGTDGAALTLLTAAARATGADREAVLAGMGSCRRLVVTDFLARELARSASESEQLALIKALSVNGNAWALETPAGAPIRAEVGRLQAAAAGALVKAFVSSTGRVKDEARDAIRVVNAPMTAALLAQSRALDPEGVDALLALIHR